MKAEDKLYKVFYEAKNAWLYFSELREKTGLSNSSLQNVLGKLEKERKLEKNKKTSNIFFRIVPKEIPLIFSQIDKERFEKLNPGVRIPLKNWLKEAPSYLRTVLLFGSASRKKEKNGSDIDILVVMHKFKDEKLQKLYEDETRKRLSDITKKINSESNYPLKIIFTNEENFETSKDHLIKQAKETGFPIFGNPEYYNEKD